MYSYLRGHPRIFMPPLKEPRYFSPDMPGARPVRCEDDYAELFAAAPEDVMTGEASPSYLASKVAIDEIMRRNAGARIVSILRNPIDVAHALHSHRLYTMEEDRPDFEEAWSLQKERQTGQCMPRRCSDPRLLQYSDYCRFAPQIRRMFEVVPEHQRLVCTFEGFAAAPRQTYLEILDFLGLPDDGRRDFTKVNANRALRSRRLAEAKRSAEAYLGEWYGTVNATLKRCGLRPGRIFGRMNVATTPRRSLGQRVRRQLAAELADDVAELEYLLGRRLDCWTDFRARGSVD